jgi:N-acetylmuramoyl-L-alanine amidase
VLVLLLLKDYPGSRLCGHRDLSPDLNHNGEIEPEECKGGKSLCM